MYVFDPTMVLRAFWVSLRLLSGALEGFLEALGFLWDALGGLLGAPREPRDYLGLLLELS